MRNRVCAAMQMQPMPLDHYPILSSTFTSNPRHRFLPKVLSHDVLRAPNVDNMLVFLLKISIIKVIEKSPHYRHHYKDQQAI